MPPPPSRVELNLPDEEPWSSLMRQSYRLSPGMLAHATTTTAAAPTWTASYSTSTPTPHRRPLTASSELPSSPASSSNTSQKFEVKRLLSRPADPVRPMTTFDASTSTSSFTNSGATVKRSNSATRFLKRRPSKGLFESIPIALARPRTAGADTQSQPRPPAPYTPPPPAASTSALSPASAYALAYARRTNMTTQPTNLPPRHPFEDVGTGRIVAVGDPTDESLSLTALSLAGFGAEKEKEREKEGGGLSRKVSARFSRRRKAATAPGPGAGVQSDVEVDDWTREKERVGIRAVGVRPGRSATVSKSRMSRHLSIDDFRGLVVEGGSQFAMEGKKDKAMEKEKEKEKERRPEGPTRPRLDSTSHHSTSHHSHTYSRKDEWCRPKEKEKEKHKDRPSRSASTPSHVHSESRSTGTTSPENKSSSGGAGMIWRLVKKMSTGTLKEKRSYQPEKAPPVPRLPATLPSSRRSSVADYGEELRPELSQFRTNSHSSSQQSSRPNTIHQSNSDISHSHSHHAHRLTTGKPSRPSMSHTNDSSVLSTSPPTSFGRTGSPRTSMSSYVDLGEEMMHPPPPLPAAVAVGKHIVAPGELNQMFVSGAGIPAAQPTPTKRSRKPRDKLALAPIPNSPASMTTIDSTTNKLKPKPNVLRRPARLDGERSPRSASMGMPSPSPRSVSMIPSVQTPRPRSNSMGTVFTFRELGKGQKTPLSEQEKADKFERLLEESDKAGGTLHASAQERLLSDSVRLSAGTFDGASVLGL